MFQNILIFLLFGLPLVYIPWIRLSYEPPKVIIFEFLVLLLLLFKLWKDKIALINYHKSQLILFAVLGLLTIFHIVTYKSNLGFFGNIFRSQGVLLLWYLMLFSFISSSISFKSPPRLIYIASFVLLLILVIIIGPNKSGRWIGALGEPNALSATIVFLFSFTILESRRVLKLIIFAISLLIILLSGSKSGMIAIGIQSGFLLLNKYTKIQLKNIVIICIAVIIISYIFPFIEGGGIYENRAEVWYTSFRSIAQSPLYGVGFGNTEEILKITADQLKNSMRFQYVDSAHNIFLDWLIQGGLIGLILFVLIVFQTFRFFIQKKQINLIAALIGLLAVASFNPLSVVSLIALWWIIGQSLYLERKNA